MADIINRSPFVVDVESKSKDNTLDHLAKQFAFKHQVAAVNYAAALVKSGHQPRITQLETSFQVRVRAKGTPLKTITFASFAEADQYVSKIDSDQKLGLFRDYTQGAQTTTVELIERYIKEECPGLKGGTTYASILNAMVEDSSNKLRQRIEQRKREMREHGRFVTPLGANREPMSSLEWLHLPLTKVRPEHLHDFIRDRLEYVEGATIDRQLDLLSRIYTLAQTRWRIHLDVSPMLGIKRPSYFNERDRRLVGDEEQRLLEAARKEDQLRSLNLHVEMLAADDIAAARALDTHYAVNAARKAAYERARQRAVEGGFPHIPLFEAFITFQLPLHAYTESLEQRRAAARLMKAKGNSYRQIAEELGISVGAAHKYCID
jgi:hypothetical protein